MKFLILRSFLLALLLNASQYSQQIEDSLYIGRQCNIILFGGFEAEGKITLRKSDTIYLKAEYKELKIPTNEIRLVTEQGISLQDVLEAEDNKRYDAFVETLRSDRKKPVKVDTSAFCDVYLQGNRKLHNVRLIAVNDSELNILNDSGVMYTNYSNVRKIVFTSRKINGLYGGLIGGSTSFLLTLLLLSKDYERESRRHSWDLFISSIAAIPGFLIGSGLGLETSEGDKYTFGLDESANKTKKIKFIIHKHHK